MRRFARQGLLLAVALAAAPDAAARKCESPTWRTELVSVEGAGVPAEVLEQEIARWPAVGYLTETRFTAIPIDFRMIPLP